MASQSRDFTYVANVVDATLSAAAAEGAAGSICNIGCGAPKTVLDLVAVISQVAERKINPRFAPPRMGDVKHSFADITRAKDGPGLRPRSGFRRRRGSDVSSVADEVAGARADGLDRVIPRSDNAGEAGERRQK